MRHVLRIARLRIVGQEIGKLGAGFGARPGRHDGDRRRHFIILGRRHVHVVLRVIHRVAARVGGIARGNVVFLFGLRGRHRGDARTFGDGPVRVIALAAENEERRHAEHGQADHGEGQPNHELLRLLVLFLLNGAVVVFAVTFLVVVLILGVAEFLLRRSGFAVALDLAVGGRLPLRLIGDFVAARAALDLIDARLGFAGSDGGLARFVLNGVLGGSTRARGTSTAHPPCSPPSAAPTGAPDAGRRAWWS